MSASDAQSPALVLRGVTHRWRRRPTPVLDDVDLEVPQGSSTWIVGRNGAGKTTILRIACGIVAATQGQVAVLGRDPVLERRKLAGSVTFLPAGNAGLYQRLTVQQHLELWTGIGLVPRHERAERTARYLALFELNGLASDRVDRISAGQRQRVRLATCFVLEAPLTLLDEPRNSLDAEGVELFANAVSAALEAGRTVVWCAPAGEDQGLTAGRTLALRDGRLEPA